MRLIPTILVAMHLLPLHSPPAAARWATPEDADYQVEFRNWNIEVNADGTGQDEVEDLVLIKRESARMGRGIARLSYNSDSSKMKVTEAYTLNDRLRIPVPRKLIEDKPLASPGSGFDETRQLTIAYPQVAVGSKLYLKSRLVTRAVPVPGFYGISFYYAWERQLAGLVTIHSALPLIVETNDPDGYLEVVTKKLTGLRPYLLTIRLKKPVHRQPMDEDEVFLHPAKLPHVWIASSRDWADTAKAGVVEEYEKVLTAPLPPAYRKIADAAAANSDPVEKMNTVTALLAEEIRYLGDWRTIRGRFIPRPIKTIAETKYGDCKDFAASAASILRAAGLNAHVAWVKRAWEPVMEDYHLPSNYLFNHAIVHVKVGARSYWLDPTNVASFASGVPKDIMDRPALVLDPARPYLDHIPLPAPADQKILITREVDFGEGGDQLRVSGTFQIDGNGAAQWIYNFFSTPQESVDQRLARTMARTDQIRDWKVKGFDLHQRNVRTLNASYSYTEHRGGFRTTAGQAYPLPNLETVDQLMMPVENRVSELFLESPFTTEREVTLKNIQTIGKEKLDCQVDSPWVTARRASTSTDNGLRVLDSLTLKRARVTNEELQSVPFAELQARLQNCFRNVAVVYQVRKQPNSF